MCVLSYVLHNCLGDEGDAGNGMLDDESNVDVDDDRSKVNGDTESDECRRLEYLSTGALRCRLLLTVYYNMRYNRVAAVAHAGEAR